MEKVASKILETISNFANENPALTAGVLAGGGLGILGGALTPETSDNPDEDPNERVNRRVRNALLAGTVGAAGTGLVGYGASNMLRPIAEGSGLSANEKLDAIVPLLAGGGAAGAAGIAEHRNKVKLAEGLIKDIYDNQKPFSGTDAPKGTPSRAFINSAMSGTTAKTFLRNSMKNPAARSELENAIARMLNVGPQDKAIHQLLERAGISTTDIGANAKLKDIFSQLKGKVTGGAGPWPAKDDLLKQLGRLGRFANRNKYTLGAGLGAAALSKWLLGNN